MEISRYVERYELRRDIKSSTTEQLRNVAKLFSQWAVAAGRSTEVESLCDDAANGWLLARKQDGLAPRTIRGNRTSLLMLWRLAADEGLVAWPRSVRTIKCPSLVIDGYDAAQMKLLIGAAEKMRGAFKKIRTVKAAWWRSLLLAYWDTSLRLADLLSIERTWIVPQADGMGLLTTVQEKTGDPVVHHLRASTMSAIDACMASPGGDNRRLIWSMPFDRRAFYRAFKRLAESAGLAGTSKWIRRGSSSEVELIRNGAGAAHLGHRTAGLFERHYRVDRIVRREVVLPPPIG